VSVPTPGGTVPSPDASSDDDIPVAAHDVADDPVEDGPVNSA
jgi:hypothetical protein